ncbi:MAG: hypothetical protein IBX44_01885 [Sulfurospirillum sp.]|nr:hypothetical protein [Sulfurospirillum sp.]
MSTIKYITVSLCLALFFFGCGEKKEEKKAQQFTQKQAPMASVEVVENKNYKEEKVAIKAKDTNESKVFYYDYNDEKLKIQIATEEKNFTPLGAALSVRSPYEHVEISMLVNKLSKNFIVKCSACHDDYANGIIGPSLLSKDSKYIYETIMQYKNGTKENVLMKELVENLDEKEIQSLADEIYVFNQQIKKIKER